MDSAYNDMVISVIKTDKTVADVVKAASEACQKQLDLELK
jgi:hypothetical protein